jgi:hypothetical protein
MSTSIDPLTVDSLVSQSMLAVEETRARCQDQLPRLYNQRQVLHANRTRRLAWEAKHLEELRELYRSLGLVQPLDSRELYVNTKPGLN